MSTLLPLILASHGSFAQGALNCAEMLIGKQTDVAIISVVIDSHIDQLREQMATSYQTLNKGTGIIILVDLMGGTPCNLASELAIEHDDVLLYCGFNIPVLLEVLNNRDSSLSEIKAIIEEAASQSCFDVSQMLTTQIEQSIEL